MTWKVIIQMMIQKVEIMREKIETIQWIVGWFKSSTELLLQINLIFQVQTVCLLVILDLQPRQIQNITSAVCSWANDSFFPYLRFVRSATVTRLERRPAVEVLWPTARTSLWPPRCQSWPARYTEPSRQPSATWSPGPITQHSHSFPMAAIYKGDVSHIYFRSF